METNTALSGRHLLEAPVAARERILRLLGMTQRPLRWAELQGALGLLTNDARIASEWLMDHGYIAPISLVKGAARSVEALWTLADKGRAWARDHGALATGGV
ncbi:MAG: hypothetical protein WDO56_08745 [Gammaproteobacteria bacterium]